jgi:hypothetical protein
MFQPNIQIALNKDGHTWIFEVDCIFINYQEIVFKVYASIVISPLEKKKVKKIIFHQDK